LTDHLKKITYDLNKFEVELGQEERRHEKDIISLNIQLGEEKRMVEVIKIHMMKK
jgi:hypothetical protein